MSDQGSYRSILQSEEISRLLKKCDPELLFESRIHPLTGFSTEEAKVYTKREDESGFGISGSKKRKYASLLPFLSTQAYQEAILIGGSRSNHVMSCLQLLNERGIRAHLFLKKTHEQNPQGNQLLLDLLKGESPIIEIDSKNWDKVEELADSYAEKQSNKTFVIPEGGSCKAALSGASTLLPDIIRNEQQKQLSFDHIFIDSGTAFSASALLVMQGLLDYKAQTHVVLTAGDEKYFQLQYSKVQSWFEDIIGRRDLIFPEVQLHVPSVAKSFGSINKTILKATREFAVKEGILTDPVYTTKLFMTAKEVIKNNRLKGKVLIIHTGGGTGLMGFGEKLSSL